MFGLNVQANGLSVFGRKFSGEHGGKMMCGITKQIVNIEIDNHVAVIAMKSILEGLVTSCGCCLGNPVIA
jgi:hypothetical protein